MTVSFVTRFHAAAQWCTGLLAAAGAEKEFKKKRRERLHENKFLEKSGTSVRTYFFHILLLFDWGEGPKKENGKDYYSKRVRKRTFHILKREEEELPLLLNFFLFLFSAAAAVPFFNLLIDILIGRKKKLFSL